MTRNRLRRLAAVFAVVVGVPFVFLSCDRRANRNCQHRHT